MERRILLLSVIAAAAASACAHAGSHPQAGRSSAASADATYDGTEIRRICLQNGIAGIGGGDVVRLVGDDGAGTLTIETLNGARSSIPAQSDAGRDTLCTIASGAMQVCPADDTHSGDVSVITVLSNTRGGAGTPSGTVSRGSPVMLFDYVHDGAGHGSPVALVTIDGQEGFLPDSEVCFATTYPDVSDVTAQLGMQTQYTAASNTYRKRSPDAIARVVVHNTEEPFEQTISDFTSGRNGTSAHVVLDRDGTLYRLVEDQFAAYHAGGSPDAMGNYNTSTLGVEVVAYDGSMFGGQLTDANFLSDAQQTSLLALLHAWMSEYGLTISDDILHDSGSAAGYADLEYAGAALTIHRLTKADRGTDCPRFLFEDSATGDEAFFRWREQNFGP
jgi:hypothetical protein